MRNFPRAKLTNKSSWWTDWQFHGNQREARDKKSPSFVLFPRSCLLRGLNAKKPGPPRMQQHSNSVLNGVLSQSESWSCVEKRRRTQDSIDHNSELWESNVTLKANHNTLLSKSLLLYSCWLAPSFPPKSFSCLISRFSLNPPHGF